MKRFLVCFLSASVPALLLAVPVQAQSLGAYAQNYRTAPSYGYSAYAGYGAAAGSAHAYEQWQDGSAATSGAAANANSTLQYRGFSSVHDFGR